jgi:hypothetical protein
MKKHLKKNSGAKKARNGREWGNVTIGFPESDTYDCPNDYIESSGTASSGMKLPVIVWGKIFEGEVEADDHPTPWFDGDPPHAADEDPDGTSWCLGPMPVTAGLNTLIVWAAFQGEATLSKTPCLFEVDDEGLPIPEDPCSEQMYDRLDRIETRLIAIEKKLAKQ